MHYLGRKMLVHLLAFIVELMKSNLKILMKSKAAFFIVSLRIYFVKFGSASSLSKTHLN